MNLELRLILEQTLGRPVTRATGLGGGSINDAYEVALADGAALFVKTHRNPPARMFETEARGLAWLAEADAIRVPRVLAVSDASPAFLALELLRPTRHRPGFDDVIQARGRGQSIVNRRKAHSTFNRIKGRKE